MLFKYKDVILSFIVGTPSGSVVGSDGITPPHSGRIFLRLIRLARRGRETVMDIYTSGNRMRIRVTRFLAPLRETIKNDPIDGQFSIRRM